jgi:hypothetical protein
MAIRLEDQPSKVIITNTSVIALTSQSRYLRAWGIGYFGQKASTAGTKITEPTRLTWLDIFDGFPHEMNDMAFLDFAAPDDGSFVVALAAFSYGPVQHTAKLYTWGRNDKNQLGRSTVGTFEDWPVAVSFPEGASSVYAGADFTLVMQGSSKLFGWGSNAYGQLLRDPQTTPTLATPTLIASGWSVATLAVGKYHVGVVWTNGTISTWGRNDTGQLGWFEVPAGSYSYVPGLVAPYGGAPYIRASKLVAGEDCFIALIDSVPTFPHPGEIIFGGTDSTGSSTLIGWGRNTANWLGIPGAPLDTHIVRPRGIAGVAHAREIAFKKNIGIIIGESRCPSLPYFFDCNLFF